MDKLKVEFPDADFQFCGKGWEEKSGEWASDEVSLASRARKMRLWLKEREEDEIVVVTHGGMVLSIGVINHS